jgi:hypothetical protein
MSDWKTANSGAELKTAVIGAVRGVAAGAGDATEFVAAGIDRLGFGSGKAVLAAHCNNTAAKVLQITSFKVAYAPDNGSGAPGSYGSDTDLLTGPGAQTVCSGTGDAYGALSFDLDFTGKDRWVRVKFTPDSTATATDVFEVGAAMILGGNQVSTTQPVTNAAVSA